METMAIIAGTLHLAAGVIGLIAALAHLAVIRRMRRPGTTR
jgi:hypothetical protein